MLRGGIDSEISYDFGGRDESDGEARRGVAKVVVDMIARRQGSASKDGEALAPSDQRRSMGGGGEGFSWRSPSYSAINSGEEAIGGETEDEICDGKRVDAS